MKKHGNVCRLPALLLAGTMMLTACSQTAAGEASATAESAAPAVQAAADAAARRTTNQTTDKSETVYAKADAAGTVTETTVEATLKPGDGDTLADVSTLRDIKNKQGDETFTTGENGALTWQNSGSAITYEGKTDAALPVTTRVTYYLNGQEITPEKLAGQSGRVRIRFDYTNTTTRTVTVDGQEVTTAVPFTAVTALVLDGDTFTNIETENGTVLDLDGSAAVVGLALPGLADSLRLTDYEPTKDTEIPAYFEVSADVTDFALDFTATVLSPGILEDADLDDLDKLDDLGDGLDELQDAADQLADGAGALTDGLQELYDGFDQYAQGVSGLNQGAEALADGLTQLYDNKDALYNGAQALTDGLNALNGALGSVDLSAGGESLDTDAVASALTGIGTDAQNVGNLYETLTPQLVQQLADMGVNLTPEQQAALAQTVAGATVPLAQQIGTNTQTVADFAQQLSGVGQQLSGLAPMVGQLQSGLGQLAAGGGQLVRGIDTYNKAIEQLSHGADALAEGSAQLDDASAALYGGLAALHEGAAAMRDGVQEFSDGDSDELSDIAGDGLQNLIRRVKAARQAGEDYQSFTGLAEGKTGSVRFLVETAEIK